MDREELIERLSKVDHEKVKTYLTILDRMFIQFIVTKMVDKAEVEDVIKDWREQIKSEINFESGARNTFLMETDMGRMMSATKDNVEDGEALMLSSLEAMDLATEIAKNNFLLDESL